MRRDKRLLVPVSEAELEAVRELAHGERVSMAEYARRRVLPEGVEGDGRVEVRVSPELAADHAVESPLDGDRVRKVQGGPPKKPVIVETKGDAEGWSLRRKEAIRLLDTGQAHEKMGETRGEAISRIAMELVKGG